MNRYKFPKKNVAFLALLVISLGGCNDFLEENPKNELSEGTFWNTRNDAMMALMGCYERLDAGWVTFDGWVVNTVYFDEWTDVATHIRTGEPCNFPQAGILPTNTQVNAMWVSQYKKIARVNYFLENIHKVNMDDTERAEMIAEARFLRCYSYFWLSQLFGNVPLATRVLTFDEANSIGQTPREEIIAFVLSELTEVAEDLPVSRPAAEKGRNEKGAALVLKGRLLMAEKRWAEAAETFKAVMELNRYQIDPRFKKLFEDEGEDSNEIIFSTLYTQTEDGQRISQQVNWPSWFGGNNGIQFFQEFVDQFLMNDGMPIEESPRYDPEHPFENRDPRLYHTVMLPGYSTVDGRVFQGHPDSIARFGQMGPGCTGYMMNKFHDREYEGVRNQYGGDFPLMRYAEVLLSRLESELEAGTGISPALLDETINKVRARAEVGMPPVTETDPDKLRKIIRRERLVELACEGGIRYWDLLRWGTLDEALSQTFHGMKITPDPAQYNGSYNINEKGHLIIEKKPFHDHNYLWPIPLEEINVNKNLVQNPGYN